MATVAEDYLNPGPSREEIDASQGAVVVEFGTGWCGYCQAAAPLASQALQAFSGVQYFRVEDGPGRRLGRSFRVKLWPTLIFLKDGVEVARLVRPEDAEAIRTALRAIA